MRHIRASALRLAEMVLDMEEDIKGLRRAGFHIVADKLQRRTEVLADQVASIYCRDCRMDKLFKRYELA